MVEANLENYRADGDQDSDQDQETYRCELDDAVEEDEYDLEQKQQRFRAKIQHINKSNSNQVDSESQKMFEEIESQENYSEEYNGDNVNPQIFNENEIYEENGNQGEYRISSSHALITVEEEEEDKETGKVSSKFIQTDIIRSEIIEYDIDKRNNDQRLVGANLDGNTKAADDLMIKNSLQRKSNFGRNSSSNIGGDLEVDVFENDYKNKNLSNLDFHSNLQRIMYREGIQSHNMPPKAQVPVNPSNIINEKEKISVYEKYRRRLFEKNNYQDKKNYISEENYKERPVSGQNIQDNSSNAANRPGEEIDIEDQKNEIQQGELKDSTYSPELSQVYNMEELKNR